MYVSEKDINAISTLCGQVTELIETGAEPEDEWQELSANSGHLFDKMKKQKHSQDRKRLIKKMVKIALAKRGLNK